MNNLRYLCFQVSKFYLIGGLALSAVAVYADSPMVERKIELDGSIASVACAEEDLPQIEKRYAACKAIFDADYEREIASTYCKPLAVAQACSHKPLSH